MLPYQFFMQQRLSQPKAQQFPVVVERSQNPQVIIQGYGRTPDDDAESIRRHTQDYGYYDAVTIYPVPEQPAPDRGTGR